MRVDLNYVLPADWNLFLVGDLHLGTVLHYHKGLLKLFDMLDGSYTGIEYPQYGGLPSNRNRIAYHGDQMECITIDDKRFSVETSIMGQILALKQECLRALSPYKKKTLFVLKGNHEDHIINPYGDITAELCSEMGVDYGSYTCVATYKDKNGNTQFRHFATHGGGVINSQAKDPEQAHANRLATLKNKLKDQMDSCFLQSMGHMHQLLILPPHRKLSLKVKGGELKQSYTSEYLRDGENWRQDLDYIHPDHRWYINTGSFYRLYADPVKVGESVIYPTSYAEKRGLKPTELGFAVALIRDNKLVGVEKEVV